MDKTTTEERIRQEELETNNSAANFWSRSSFVKTPEFDDVKCNKNVEDEGDETQNIGEMEEEGGGILGGDKSIYFPVPKEHMILDYSFLAANNKSAEVGNECFCKYAPNIPLPLNFTFHESGGIIVYQSNALSYLQSVVHQPIQFQHFLKEEDSFFGTNPQRINGNLQGNNSGNDIHSHYIDNEKYYIDSYVQNFATREGIYTHTHYIYIYIYYRI